MKVRKRPSLPYRSSGEELTRFLDARGRGREYSQIQTLNFTAHGLRGTVVAAKALGFIDEGSAALSASGQYYTLADASAQRQALLSAMLEYTPYELLLEAIFEGHAVEQTALSWIEKWWHSAGYGSSRSNREEAAITFARLVEFVGLGQFVLGRRGRASRIEWDASAPEVIRRTRSGEGDTEILKYPTVKEGPSAESRPGHVKELPTTLEDEPTPPTRGEANNVLTLRFEGGRQATLSLPPVLRASEKARLLAAIELLVAIDEGSRSDADKG